MKIEMEILLNNRKETIDKEELSLAELILYKNFTFRLLVTKLNGQLIKKDVRADTIIRDGDEVNVLHMISGG
jgi:sulfur carrier protein